MSGETLIQAIEEELQRVMAGRNTRDTTELLRRALAALKASEGTVSAKDVLEEVRNWVTENKWYTEENQWHVVSEGALQTKIDQIIKGRGL